MDLELLEDVVNVVLHGGGLDAEAMRDLLVRQSFLDKDCDLRLA
jgi:hypothetical protein